MQRYLTLSTYFRGRFGRRVQKIPLDAGADCPNRDGTLSTKGCVFCNLKGSGSGLGMAGLSLAEQWDAWRARYTRKYPDALFMAYLQSFSNTYGPIGRLQGVLDGLRDLPDLAALAVGTRPDCVDADKVALLAEFPVQETWLELGLQSSNNATLERINRGHTFTDFEHATRLADDAGLKVCVHVIAGLPGEDEADFLRTIRALRHLPVHGIKFHQCYVCRGATLAADWKAGRYTPLTREAYVRAVGRAIGLLGPEVVVQRLTGDPAPGELLAPDWATDKHGTLRAIAEYLDERDIRQGQSESIGEHR